MATLYEFPVVSREVGLARRPTAPISIREKKALEYRGLDLRINDFSKIVPVLEGDTALPVSACGTIYCWNSSRLSPTFYTEVCEGERAVLPS